MKANCINHGLVESSSWKLSPEGKLCGRCFKPRRARLGFLSGTSHRVQADREQNEKEMLQPYLGHRPNPDFLRAYPDQSQDFYSDEELKEMGAPKLKSRKKTKFKSDEYHRQAKPADPHTKPKRII